MKVVVGLGNPGSPYAGTRHNLGFEVVDILAGGPGGGRFQQRFEADLAQAREDREKVLLVKPRTFMNLSGSCVRGVLDYYQLTAADLLVVCDDVNLPLGQLRLRTSGSAGGHKGLKDIEQHLGTRDYARLRLGVSGPDRRREDLVDFVLDRFKPSERAVVQDMTIRAAQAVGLWIREGAEACMNRFNAPDQEAKPKKTRKQNKNQPTAPDETDKNTPPRAADQSP